MYQPTKQVPAKTQWVNGLSTGKGYVAVLSDEEKAKGKQYLNFKKILITDDMNSEITEAEIEELLLPKYMQISDPIPGEHMFMSLHSHPLVARLHKLRKDKHIHIF